MYPELYPELQAKSRKFRGFALSIGGSFVFMLTTLTAFALSDQYLYLIVSGFSLGAVGLIFLAHRSHFFLAQVAFLMAASATLAAETAIVALVFPVPLAGAFALLTLGSCLVTAKGIHDVESTASMDQFSGNKKKRREMPFEQQQQQHAGGGE